LAVGKPSVIKEDGIDYLLEVKDVHNGVEIATQTEKFL
jgi:hypothetical protein